MARLKLVYIGGGSTRAAGTVASFVHQGTNFSGSELVLVDLDPERLAIVQTLGMKMARHAGVDLRITATTDRRAGLTDADAVLTSYRPGGFDARHLDERIPLLHGAVGQETQGAGGFFMALRSVHVMQGILDDVAAVAPRARIFNYTNPVNLVAEAVTQHTDSPFYAFCEGPIVTPRDIVRSAGLDPDRLDAVSVGLNHNSWSVRHLYDGADVMPLLAAAYERLRDDPAADAHALRMLRLTVTMGTIPSDYFQYYYFEDEVLSEQRAKGTTRAQDIMGWTPDYWAHYREQAAADVPRLDPARSRGGIHELELAIDGMDAIYNDRGIVLPINLPNDGAVANLPVGRVVEARGYFDRHGIRLLHDGGVPDQVSGLVMHLSEYQALAGAAAWRGRRIDGVRALAANPLVRSLAKAEALYDALAAAHRDYLPERLLS